MRPDDTAYDEALETFRRAVSAFADGDIQRGDELLASLNIDAIEQDRQQLRLLAGTAKKIEKVLPSHSVSRGISPDVRQGVQQRDRYHCRFTGRRLIDTQVFHQVSRISSVFHFDEHHSVKATSRGPAGHPMVRTHAAAYEHATPLVCGGTSRPDNIVHTSVQLNESKGATVLELIPVPDDDWTGLVDYLPRLRQQPSSKGTSAGPRTIAVKVPKDRTARVSQVERQGENTNEYREAAKGLDITIFALRDDRDAEQALLRFRKANKNWFFTTRPNQGDWKIHRLYCSSLDFSGKQLLTLKPKVCSKSRSVIEAWASRFGVQTTACSRCRVTK